MAAHDTTVQEEDSRNAPVSQEATPNPMEAVMKELAELRKVNQKLNERLDNALHPNAKKMLFNERKCSSVDPSRSVSIVCNDLIALGNVTSLLCMVKLKLTTLLSTSQTRARLAEWLSLAAATWNFCVRILHLKV